MLDLVLVDLDNDGHPPQVGHLQDRFGADRLARPDVDLEDRAVAGAPVTCVRSYWLLAVLSSSRAASSPNLLASCNCASAAWAEANSDSAC